MNQEFNNKPLIAVGVLVIDKDKALIIKRGEEPNKFLWSIPGGLVEIGEELEEAAIREVKEEMGIDIKIEKMIGIFNCINRNKNEIEYHYVIIDYIAREFTGSIKTNKEILDFKWMKFNELHNYELTNTTRELFREFIRKNNIL